MRSENLPPAISAAESSGRQTILRVGLGQLAVECITRVPSAAGFPPARSACNVSQTCLMVAAACGVFGVGAEHVREQPCAQEGVRHDLLHDRHRDQRGEPSSSGQVQVKSADGVCSASRCSTQTFQLQAMSVASVPP